MLNSEQLRWCDEKLCLGKYREYREQADRASADTDSARAKMAEFSSRKQPEARAA